MKQDVNRLHEKHKLDSARRVTRLGESLAIGFEDRVTLLAGTTFHVNTLARLAGSTRLMIRYTEHARLVVSVEQSWKNRKLMAL